MPIVGLGTDLVRIPRFQRLHVEGRERVLERLFTAAERSYACSHRDPAPHLAVRFAAKEAFLKALGTGWRDGISWHDMEVVRDALGAPSLRLTGRAAELARNKGVSSVHLSYSHEGEYGVATVVLEQS